MKFCPKCGGLMVPITEKGKRYLKCSKCGYVMRLEKKTEYKLKEEVDKKSRVKTTSIVSRERGVAPSPEEKEQRIEEYYEIALDLIQEEFEGGPEEE